MDLTIDFWYKNFLTRKYCSVDKTRLDLYIPLWSCQVMNNKLLIEII